MKKHIAATVVCIALSLIVLDAHVIVTPRESAAGAEQVYTVRGTKRPASVTTIVPKGGATGTKPADPEHKHP